ncbi:hypothetical protein diail_11134 [Diaporthe ilicicola]|nr:hypothetical protein diail_11134 [Diaporthe ilicicola]
MQVSIPRHHHIIIVNSLIFTPLDQLRAIAHALCEDETQKKRVIDAFRFTRGIKPRAAPHEAPDHTSLIENATTQELYTVSRHYKPVDDGPNGTSFEVIEPLGPIKTATERDIRIIMLALCENETTKKRIVDNMGGSVPARASPCRNRPSCAHQHGDRDRAARYWRFPVQRRRRHMKIRVLESLQVLTCAGNLRELQISCGLFKCLNCKKSFYEKGKQEQFLPVPPWNIPLCGIAGIRNWSWCHKVDANAPA